MHLYMCAQVQGSQVTHDPYTDVLKLLISSNSIRLLNIAGEGNLNYCFCLYFILSTLAEEDSSDKGAHIT